MYAHYRSIVYLSRQDFVEVQANVKMYIPLECLIFLCMSSGETPHISVPLSTSVGLGLGRSPHPLGSECRDSRASSRPLVGFFNFLMWSLATELLDTELLWLSYLWYRQNTVLLHCRS